MPRTDAQRRAYAANVPQTRFAEPPTFIEEDLVGAQIVGGRLGCGEMTPAEYSGYRALLVPHGAMVAEVLRAAH